jgi:hypothetical protein
MALALSDGLEFKKKFDRRDLYDEATHGVKSEVTLNGKKALMSAFNSEVARRSEHGSACSHCSARGMAKLAALMANGGKIGE